MDERDNRAAGAPDPTGPPRRPMGPPRQYHVAAPVAPPAAGVPAQIPAARAPQRPPRARDPRREPFSRSLRPARRRRWLRPKWRWLWLYLPALLVVAALLVGVWGWWKFNSLARVDLGDSLATPSGGAVNYLLVGSDSREGVTSDTPNAGAIGPDVKGRRSDTIIVLRLEADRATMMSIPRDLWVRNAATGREGRVNAAYNDGPANLVRTVTANLGIPIHHYVEVGFVSFSGMVDAMGGITIDVPRPAFDRNSGLRLPDAGPQVLDGPTALAYVRSRRYTEVIDGTPRQDPTADLGRQQRQQQFIRTVLREAGATRNPVTLVRVVGAAAGGVRVDTRFGIGDAWSLVRRLSGAEPASVVLPTVGANRGGASVLELRRAEAAPILRQFGAG